MRPDVTRKLIDINYQFYQTFSCHFSATRQRVQPGVRSILHQIHNGAAILDLGCGNGNLWSALASQGYRGCYVGVDFSQNLLQHAAADIEQQPSLGYQGNFPLFFQADLTEKGWSKQVGRGKFEAIMAFAVFHHLPGIELRLSVIREIQELLSDDGLLFLSVWQLMNSARLKGRIQDWKKVGLTPDDVELGDYLMDWRSGGIGMRYVHQFSLDELNDLASESGFSINSSFYSDGKEGNLSLYQFWTKKKEYN